MAGDGSNPKKSMFYSGGGVGTCEVLYRSSNTGLIPLVLLRLAVSCPNILRAR